MSTVVTKGAGCRCAGIHDHSVGEDLRHHFRQRPSWYTALRRLRFLDYIATDTFVPEDRGPDVAGRGAWLQSARHDARRRRDGAAARSLPAGALRPGGIDRRVVEEDKALHGDRVKPGDQLIGYASTGTAHQRLHPCAQDHLRVDESSASTTRSRRWTTRWGRSCSRCIAVTRPRCGRYSARYMRSPISPAAGFRGIWCALLPAGADAIVDAGSLAVAAAVSCIDARGPGKPGRDAPRLQSGSRHDCCRRA